VRVVFDEGFDGVRVVVFDEVVYFFFISSALKLALSLMCVEGLLLKDWLQLRLLLVTYFTLFELVFHLKLFHHLTLRHHHHHRS
jgi:hypothetical protein